MGKLWLLVLCIDLCYYAVLFKIPIHHQFPNRSPIQKQTQHSIKDFSNTYNGSLRSHNDTYTLTHSYNRTDTASECTVARHTVFTGTRSVCLVKTIASTSTHRQMLPQVETFLCVCVLSFVCVSTCKVCVCSRRNLDSEPFSYL